MSTSTKKKWYLKVSRDFGAHYDIEDSDADPEKLVKKGRDMDIRGLRWFIMDTEHDRGEFYDYSAIHKEIAGFLALKKESTHG